MDEQHKLQAAVAFLQELGFDDPAGYAQAQADASTFTGKEEGLAELWQKIATQARKQTSSLQ